MKYDCVVIGGGIAGIVAATGLAAKGKKTLLLEKQNKPGGYFSGFVNEDGDKFDYAISYLLSCGEGDVFTEYLKKLGIEKEIHFRKLDRTDDIYISDRHIVFEEGRGNFKKTLYQEFPESKAEINELMTWLIDYQEGITVQGSKAMKFFMQNFRRDYEEFLEQKITDDLLKGVLSLRIQADPASLMIMAGFLVECYFKGMYYPEGGSNELVQKLLQFFTEHGGEIKTDEKIVKFHCNEERAVSAESINGQIYEAENFVFNGDVIKLNREFLEGSNKESALKKIDKRVVGHSSLSIFLTVENYDLSTFESGRVYATESERIFDTYRAVESNHIPEHPVIKLHFPCTYDSSLTKGNRKIIRIETDVLYDETKDSEKKYLDFAEQILQYVENKLLRDISKNIVYKRIVTPVEFAKMFGHTNGSGTGWAHTTQNMMISKYTQKTAFRNLFIAGQWGEFGSGLRQLVLSGEKALDLVLKNQVN